MAMTESTPPPPTKALPAIPKSPEPVDSSRSSRSSSSLRRKPVPNSVPHPIPSFSIDEHEDTTAGGRESRQSGSSFALSSAQHSRTPSRDIPDPAGTEAMPVTRDIPIRQLNISNGSHPSRFSSAAELDVAGLHEGTDLSVSALSLEGAREQPYYKQPTPPPPSVSPREHVQSPTAGSSRSSTSDNSGNRNNFNFGFDGPLQVPRTTIQRPNSAYTLGSELNNTRGASHSPHLSVGGSPVNGSTTSFARNQAAHRRSPENRNSSYLDLLKLPYNQQIAPTTNLLNTHLKHAVGENASLLDTKKTLDMYRANVKSQDNVVQYEFALYMVQIAREITALPQSTESHGLVPADLLREARQILTRLADRGYPFAQYYLGDGYASGLFNKDKPDYNTAFNYFIAANKHGHAESSYRAALCYEFGWGCRKDYAKAAQYYRTAASKNHPGAAARLGRACLTGDMGLQNKYREGVKWLKRATESADYQYNSAPYELGLLHETGYGEDIFKDEVYAVQLFTQAAELGHPQAALKLGEAYEHGLLRCPKDAALSVHYYNCAAQADIPEAMMNLCAWYLLGAPPVLEKDENEAYEWAKKAAVEHGLPKAEYACGYFTEMGIGCRRDPLEANVWYVKAADHGDERAKQRLAIIQAAASGEGPSPSTEKTKLKKGGKDENCLVM